MGLGDNRATEEWLYGNIPEAFYYRLPSNARINLVVHDMSALQCETFSSTHNTTTSNMIDRICSVIATVTACPASSASILDIEARDSDDGCTFSVRQRNPGELPEPAELHAEAKNPDSELFALSYTSTATVCITADDSRYTPSIRDMLHEDRYADSKSSKPSFTDDDLAQRNLRLFANSPLIGKDYNPTDAYQKKLIGGLRRQAYGHGKIRSAISAYVPLAVVLNIVEECRCKTCHHSLHAEFTRNYEIIKTFSDNAMSTTARRLKRLCEESPDSVEVSQLREALHEAIDFEQLDLTQCQCAPYDAEAAVFHERRRVVIDGVCENFDMETYSLHPLSRMPPNVTKDALQRKRAVVIEPQTRRLISVTAPPAIGESDLKLVHNILTYSSPGDDVLIRNKDSDILYILLQNMHRFLVRDEDGCNHAEPLVFNRRIFLDVWYPNVSLSRVERRFICVNRLYYGLMRHGVKRWGFEDTLAAEGAIDLFTGVAMMFGTDYNTGISGIGAAKIFATLENDTLMQRIAPSAITYFHAPPGIPTHAPPEFLPRLLIFNDTFVRCFVGDVVIQAMTKANKLRFLAKPIESRYNWTELEKVKGTGKARSFAVPDWSEIRAIWRRISWAMNYTTNAPCAIGTFPSPAADLTAFGVTDSAKNVTGSGNPHSSLWGWSFAPQSQTNGSGKNRHFISANWKLLLETSDTPTPTGKAPDKWIPIIESNITGESIVVLECAFAEYMARCESIPSGGLGREVIPQHYLDTMTLPSPSPTLHAGGNVTE